MKRKNKCALLGRGLACTSLSYDPLLGREGFDWITVVKGQICIGLSCDHIPRRDGFT